MEYSIDCMVANISYIIILIGIFLILIFLLTRSPKLKISNNLQSLSVIYVKIFVCEWGD